MLNNLFQYNIYDYDSIFVTNILILYSYFYQGWTFAARCRQRLLIGCWRSQLRCTGIIVHHTQTHVMHRYYHTHVVDAMQCTQKHKQLFAVSEAYPSRNGLDPAGPLTPADGEAIWRFRQQTLFCVQITKITSMACISFVSLGSLQWVHPTHPNKVWTHRHPRTTVLLSSSAVDYRYRYCAGSGWLWGEAISCTLPPWWRSSPVWRGRGRKRVHSSPKAPITPLHHPSQVCL